MTDRPTPSPVSSLSTHTAWATGLGLALVLLWDALGLDIAVAYGFGNAQGFALRNHWLLTDWMHDGAKRLAWLLVLLLVLSIWWPRGWLRRLHQRERVQWVVTVLLSLIVVGLVKHFSRTTCPWDVTLFGGATPYVPHWALGVADGGGGRCFPAGHASAGFAFIGGYFALRRALPVQARWCLALSLLAGLALGLGQQVRGAHYMSHTLWTAWLCWATGWLSDMVATRWSQRKSLRVHA